MSAEAVTKPQPGEYASFFEKYVTLVGPGHAVALLEEQRAEVAALLARTPESKAGYRYAEGKWSIGDVVGHVIDGERVFGFRAMAFARGEQAPLPGFEQDPYVEAAAATMESVKLGDLAAEFDTLRRSHILMFSRLGDDDWARTGVASGHPVSVRALSHVLVGHVRHHLGVLREKYGLS